MFNESFIIEELISALPVVGFSWFILTTYGSLQWLDSTTVKLSFLSIYWITNMHVYNNEESISMYSKIFKIKKFYSMILTYFVYVIMVKSVIFLLWKLIIQITGYLHDKDSVTSFCQSKEFSNIPKLFSFVFL